jgi:hypothetical protein
MRRMIAIAALMAALLTGLAGTPWASAADPICQRYDERTGVCEAWIDPTPSSPGPTDPADPASGDTGDSGPACVNDDKAIPCKSRYGQWSNGEQCYVEPMEPQPGPADPFWSGHEPGDGAIYWCVPYGAAVGNPIWLQNPPTGPGGPTPYEIALGAVARLHLKAINVGVVPEPGTDSIGLVGMPTWMWVDNPTASTFGPTGISASAGGITVTLDAKVERIEWDMGDGSEHVVCTGPGTPYSDHFGKKDSPTCGHRYESTSWSQPGHTFTVTAHSYWRIDWAGAGQSGTIRLDPLQDSVDVRVGEAQVLTQ